MSLNVQVDEPKVSGALVSEMPSRRISQPPVATYCRRFIEERQTEEQAEATNAKTVGTLFAIANASTKQTTSHADNTAINKMPVMCSLRA